MTDLLLAQSGSTLLHGLIGLGMVLVSVIMIALVLVQQGKGGGLVGLGGMGGASVMGTRGDRQVMYGTIGVAAVWFLLCILGIVCLSNASSPSPKRLTPSSALGLPPGTSTVGPDAETTGGETAGGDAVTVPGTGTVESLPPASGSTVPGPSVGGAAAAPASDEPASTP